MARAIRTSAIFAICVSVCALSAASAQAATSPEVTTRPADDLTAHSVRLNGSVDPAGNGEVTSCAFEYGLTEAYGQGSVPCEPATPYSGATQVSAKITGLTPEDTYHFRLTAANASPGSETHGADQTFTTPGATRNPISSFGTASEPIAAGVDNSSGPSHGSVYVVGFGNDLEKFNEEGDPTAFSGLGSATLGGFANPPTAVAVDPTNGDILVADEGDGKVTKYAPSGEPEAFSDSVDPYVSANALSGTGSGGFSPFGIAVDKAGNIYVSNHATKEVDKFNSAGHFLLSFNGGVKYPFTGGPYNSSPDALAVDSTGDVYVVANRIQEVVKFNSFGEPIPADGVLGDTAILASGGSQSVAVDPSNGETYVSNANTGDVEVFNSTGSLTNLISFPGEGSYGMAVNGEKHRLYFANINASNVRISPAIPGTPIPDVGTGNATDVTRTSATLNGIVDPAGTGNITECYFEVSGEPNVPCEQHTPFTSSTEVTGSLSGLEPATAYEYHLVAKSETGGLNLGQEETFTTNAELPVLSGLAVSGVGTDIATLHANVNPNKAETAYHFEYVDDEKFQENGFAEAVSVPTPTGHAGSGNTNVAESQQTGVLKAGTLYHFRLVATNSGGTSTDERTFTTFSTGSPNEPCLNAHVRQQTSASQLPDCRAYELVSAANTSNNDVESSIVPAQSPFDGYPHAEDPPRVLYTLHDGTIPGVNGDPTNDGSDPYLATRTANGWMTSYVGISENDTPSTAPFASTLLEADPSLDTLAFGGKGICSPCFADGSSGTPIHLPNGELIQGMAGPLNPGPSATPDGYIAKRFSADGSHFVFGSASKFAEGGNSNGVVSIYDRDLKTGETHVVSDSPGGTPLPCLQNAGEGECHAPNDSNGIAELAISSDGSRILVAQKVTEDVEGNVYWRLYMNIGDNEKTIDLTPGATKGVLFDGMTEDGSKVFFSSEEHLTHQDEHHSGADIYEAEVSESGATLHLISKGEKEEEGQPGDTAACTPASNWNTVSGGPNCSAVAIAGGGGLASEDGTIYFLSPELLNGPSNGTAGQPNLYVARPGAGPRYVTTLETDNPAVVDAVSRSGKFSYGDFQVSPSGDFAAFTSALPLTPSVDNGGFTQVYRYDASTSELDCASCDPTGATDEGEGTLSDLGLGLTNDGRVFFNSTEALAARDEDEKTDVYEWEPRGTVEAKGGYECQTAGGCVGLISTGTSPSDSRLLSVSADGTDALFFTRDVLVPQDQNRDHVKIYDARELGGFPYFPPQPKCASSDECHGPGSAAPSPPEVGTIAGTAGNVALGKKKANHHHKQTHHHPRRRHKRTKKHHLGGTQ
jgi:hypothetical protein